MRSGEAWPADGGGAVAHRRGPGDLLAWWRAQCLRRKRRLNRKMARGRKRYTNNDVHSRWRVNVPLGVVFLLWVSLQILLHQPGVSCSKSWLERLSIGLAWPAGFYCGPANGGEYTRTPRDPLDAICAQHDFCIEHTPFPVSDGGFELFYPKGFRPSEDDEPRCGLSLGAWRNAEWGQLIMQCDLQLVESVVSGFQCAAELPRSVFCFDADFRGRSPCTNYPWFHPLFVPCRLAAFGIKHFEQRKIRRTNITITNNLLEQQQQREQMVGPR